MQSQPSSTLTPEDRKILEKEWNCNIGPPSDNDHAKLQDTGQIEVGLRNISLCRYCNIVPYDKTLVPMGNGNFLNASIIPLIEKTDSGTLDSLNVIISQAPIFSGHIDTRNRMWRCVFEHNVKTIAALAKVEEGYTGCCQYFPLSLRQPVLEWASGDEQVKVTLLKKPVKLAPGLELRELRVEIPNEVEAKNVHHFLYNKWPNYGVPDSTSEVTLMAEKILERQVTKCKPRGMPSIPLLIHCSGGVGRSGVFATILAALALGKKNVQKLSGKRTTSANKTTAPCSLDFSLAPIVTKLRRFRHPWCVETFPQLEYAYLAMIRLWDKRDSSVTPKSSDQNVSSDVAARKIASFFHRKKSSLNNTEKKSSFPKAENYLAPFNPTDKTAIQEVVRLANFQSTDVLYDIGCGDGRVLIEAVRSSKLTSAVGVEYDQKYAKRAGHAVSDAGLDDFIKIIHGDACRIAMDDATVLFVYLVPEGLMKIRPKLIEMLERGGCRILSNIFSIPDLEPTRVFEYTKAKLKLYYYDVLENSA